MMVLWNRDSISPLLHICPDMFVRLGHTMTGLLQCCRIWGYFTYYKLLVSLLSLLARLLVEYKAGRSEIIAWIVLSFHFSYCVGVCRRQPGTNGTPVHL